VSRAAPVGSRGVEAQTIPLWPGGAPGAGVAGPQEERESWLTPPEPEPPFRNVRNVTEPALLAYVPPPERATGTAVVVCPGGGHHLLSMDHEGIGVAERLAERGIAAFVLKYRLLPSPAADDEFATRFQQLMADPDVLQPLLTPEHRATILADGQRAVALVRERAAEWHLAADRIGILGFSAGGHVAAAVALRNTPESRPDFVAPIYAGVWEEFGVPDDAPPMFLAYATDDPLGERIVGESLRLYTAWWRAGLPVELHAYATGGHGFGMRRQGLPMDGWIDRFQDWLVEQKLLTPAPVA
jgi:acetyl esterase/lipase